MTRPHVQAKISPDAQTHLAFALATADMSAIINGNHGDPFAVLGVQPHDGGWSVRVFAPGATQARIEVEGGATVPLTRLDEGGIFGAVVPERPARYSVRARNDAAEWRFVDPYQFGPILGELDEHLISEGTHMRLWRTLGAHPVTHEGVAGVSFAVWAPAARRVSVVGDFNDWDGRRHPMRKRGKTGVWDFFLPDLGPGARYKYEVVGPGDGLPQPKSDPVGFEADLRPDNCSVVRSLHDYDWSDAEWMARRAAAQNVNAPVSIYEVHLGSWRRKPDGTWLSYRELAETLVPYVKALGFTHIECLPVSEHPFDGSWGYQPVGLYAPPAALATRMISAPLSMPVTGPVWA